MNIDRCIDNMLTTVHFVMFLFCSLTSAMGGGPHSEFHTFVQFVLDLKSLYLKIFYVV